MNVVITGAGGMLGSALASDIAKRGGSNVYALTGNVERTLSVFSGKAGNHVVDNSDACGLIRDINPDFLIHCAFSRGNDGASLGSALDFAGEILSFVPEGCATVNVSSQSVYCPERRTAATEKGSDVAPAASYGVAKYSTEVMLARFCRSRLKTNLRLASLLSPSFDDRFVNKMVRSGRERGLVEIAGPNNVFGFLSAQDAASGIEAMLGSPLRRWEGVYNLGPKEKGLSLEAIGECVVERLTIKGHPCRFVKSGLSECTRSSALDSTLFQRDFGWHSSLSLAEIVDSIIDFQDVALRNE